jgi:ABC-type polysaccharide/polyol phosphate export permease
VRADRNPSFPSTLVAHFLVAAGRQAVVALTLLQVLFALSPIWWPLKFQRGINKDRGAEYLEYNAV